MELIGYKANRSSKLQNIDRVTKLQNIFILVTLKNLIG